MERRGENYPPPGEPGMGMRGEPMTPPREATSRERIIEPTVTRADIYGVMTPGMMTAPRDITRWGPIFAGFVASLSLIVLLGVLGAAVGLQIAGQGAPATAPGATTTTPPSSTGAAIWAAVTLIIAFFAGGWVTGRTSAIAGATSGWIHGFAVWSLTVSVLLFLGAFGLAGVIGAITGNPAAAGALTTPGTPGTSAAQNFSLAQGAAWGTFIALLLGLIASVLGGWVGGTMAEQNVVTPTPPQVQAR